MAGSGITPSASRPRTPIIFRRYRMVTPACVMACHPTMCIRPQPVMRSCARWPRRRCARHRVRVDSEIERHECGAGNRIVAVRLAVAKPELRVQASCGELIGEGIEQHALVADRGRSLDRRPHQRAAEPAATSSILYVQPLHLAAVRGELTHANAADELAIVTRQQQAACRWRVHVTQLVQFGSEPLKSKIHAQPGCVLLEQCTGRGVFEIAVRLNDDAFHTAVQSGCHSSLTFPPAMGNAALAVTSAGGVLDYPLGVSVHPRLQEFACIGGRDAARSVENPLVTRMNASG